MRIQRSAIVSESSAQVFHVVSRVVDKRMIFGDKEKGQFLNMMRQLEEFSGVEVLSYILMGNHFHLLLYVPAKPESIPIEDIRNRMKHIYSSKKISEFDNLIKQMKESGYKAYEDEFYEKMRNRMFNLSSFLKDLKLKFSKWYNKENERKGTLWEERFKSLLVESTLQSLMRVSAYIELNAVRANIVKEPHQYKWCSYTEAIAGGQKARNGIVNLMTVFTKNASWDEVAKEYRKNFIYIGVVQNEDRKGFSEEKLEDVMKHGGDLAFSEKIKTRLRYLTDGVAIGSKEFIEDFIDKHARLLAQGRKSKGVVMDKSKEGNIYSFRNVR